MAQHRDPARDVLARANKVARLLAECKRRGVDLSPELSSAVTEALTALEIVRGRLTDHLMQAPVGIRGSLRRLLRHVDTARHRISELQRDR
jgi:hypothetical protein